MKTAIRITKFIAGGIEVLLGIPVLGASIILGLSWIPLGVMLVFHIINLVLSKNENLPFLGMIMHILTAVFVIIEACKMKVE